tara:strand:+ start:193 stop:1128 length:936 start_codon:yes stop_codon:yes gene_type:complete
MKIDPINIILDNNLIFKKKFYFITGNEITFMERIKEEVVNKESENGTASIERVKDITQINSQIGLFDNKKIFIINDSSNIDNDILENTSLKNNVVIFFCENTPKTKKIKNVFLKRKDSFLVECYEISKDDKIKVVNKHLNLKNIKIDESVYWDLIERLENKFVFLEKELGKILSIGNKINNDLLNKVFSKNNFNLDRVFFSIMESNKKLVNIYNQKITNQNEVNDFYYSFKQFCLLILNNENEDVFINNIPRYLFREKKFLIEVYKKYTPVKKKGLADLLYETESVFRKNGQLSLSLGLRFLLIFKKITTS